MASLCNKAAVLELLSKGTRVIETAAGSETALCVCAKYTDRDIVEALIEHSTALDIENTDRLTALDFCLEKHAQDVTVLLAENGCRLGSSPARVLMACTTRDSKSDPLVEALVKRFRETGSGPY